MRDIEGTIFVRGAADFLNADSDGLPGNLLVPTLIGDELRDKEVAQVAAGHTHILCVTTEGALYSWGFGEYGKLGLGAGIIAPKPTLVGSALRGKPMA